MDEGGWCSMESIGCGANAKHNGTIIVVVRCVHSHIHIYGYGYTEKNS